MRTAPSTIPPAAIGDGDVDQVGVDGRRAADALDNVALQGGQYFRARNKRLPRSAARVRVDESDPVATRDEDTPARCLAVAISDRCNGSELRLGPRAYSGLRDGGEVRCVVFDLGLEVTPFGPGVLDPKRVLRGRPARRA